MTRSLLACVLLFLCLGGVAAQVQGLLSKRPFVIRTFDSKKNESLTTAYMVDPQSDAFRNMAVASPDYPPPALRLHSAEYTFPGTTPSRPQSISFILVPLDKPKAPLSYSITLDGAVVQEGETTVMERCCVEINGHSANPQLIILSVPIETFERLTKASKIEFKLNTKRGKFSVKLNDYQRKTLTVLADTIK